MPRISSRRAVDIVEILTGLLITLVTSAKSATQTIPTTTQSTTTTESGRSYYDDFLAFPPEYVALLGLGVLFIILFIIVVIIVCVTAKPKYKY